MFEKLKNTFTKVSAPAVIAAGLFFTPPIMPEANADIVVLVTEGTIIDSRGITLGASYNFTGTIDTNKSLDTFTFSDQIGFVDNVFENFSIDLADVNITGTGGSFTSSVANGTSSFVISSDNITNTSGIPDIVSFGSSEMTFTGLNLSSDSISSTLSELNFSSGLSEQRQGSVRLSFPPIATGTVSINNAMTTAVPEPTALALLALSGLGMSLVRFKEPSNG